MNDRNLGYVVILFLIIFLLISAVYFSLQFLLPVHYRIIIFNSPNTLSFLKKQDPVRLRGVEAGQIRNIFLKGDTTCVEIETRHALDIHQGYRIFAEAKGFMGDRYIEINPGDIHAPPIISAEPLSGIFPIGPTEAIAYAAGLKTKVRSLIILTDELRNGSPGRKPFTARFSSMMKKLDSISVSLSRILSNVDRFAIKNADTIAAALKKADYFSNKMNSSAPAATVTIENILIKSKKLLVAVDSLTASFTPFIERLNDMETNALNKDLIKLRQQIESLRNFINELHEDGLKIHVRL
jgi:hypothetical protein